MKGRAGSRACEGARVREEYLREGCQVWGRRKGGREMRQGKGEERKAGEEG